MISHMRIVSLLVLSLISSSCGYNLRGNTRPFFERNQIHTLYVEPVKNNSYKAGVDITVYNALRKRIALGGYVQIIDQEPGADATFSSTVNDASYSPFAIANGQDIQSGDPQRPTHPELSNILVAKSYNVTLRVQFKLQTHHPEKRVYYDEISRAKTFPGTVYLGQLGDTTALINESDFERMLSDLAASVVTDAEESVNTLF